MPVLNTDTSIVDYLKSVGQDSSFGARTTLATQAGIKGYTGSADQNISLLSWAKSNIKAPGTPAPAPVVSSPVSTPPSSQGAGTGSVPSSPSQVQNQNQALSYVNGNQPNDAATYSSANSTEPPIRNSVKTYDQVLADIKSAIGLPATGTPEATPASPNLEQSYKDLRTSYGVDSLESNLNELNKQATDLATSLQAFKDQERNKPVAENVIQGRISQEQQTIQEQLDIVNRNIATTTNQLNTKYNVINTLMKYKSDDYATAKDKYDTQFSQNLQLINLAKGISDSQKTDAEQAADDARANAQIIYNSITSGGLDFDNVDDAQKLAITKLETQAGLPSGFYKTLQNKNPKADIVTSTSREINGKKYVDVIMRNQDGSLSTKSMLVGSVDAGGGKATEAETTRYDAKRTSQQLASRVGDDGYVSPSDYKTARRAWVNAGYTASDFDSRFAKTYVNPDDYETAGVSSKSIE